MKAEKITAGETHSGIRITIPCLLDKSKHTIQIDLGYGDAVTPGESECSLPGVLQEKPIHLHIYPIESVVSEKFEAMITLDKLNSRMKDFFDIHTIFRDCHIEEVKLSSAIRNTLSIRETVLTEYPVVFSDVFYTDPHRVESWEQFMKRIGATRHIEFRKVGFTIKAVLEPIYKRIREELIN